MRNYRWYLAAVLALGLAALAAVGTAGGAGERQGVSGSVSIIAKWTGDEQASFQAVLAPFKKANPGLKIKYTGAGDNVPQIVSTAIAGGNPPDIATLPQPGLMKQFAERGAAKPITFARGVIAKNYAPVWLSLGSVKGKLYGLFFKGANKSTVWYNVAAFKAAGVKAPATVAQLRQVAQTIKASGLPAYSIAGADGWTLTDLFENIYLRQAGGALYDRLSAHTIPWTHPSVKAALRTMALIIGDSDNILGNKSGALQTDFPTSVSNVFQNPAKAAMVIEGDFVPGVVASSTKLKPISGYNVFPFPSVRPATKASVMGGGDVVVMFKDNPAARALISYLATPQAATIWAKRGGFSSPNKNVKPGAYSDALTRKTATGLAQASLFRFDLSDLQPAAFGSTAGQGMWKLFQDFVEKPTDVNGIAAKLEASAAKAYKK
ncbi:MAG: extracellular solute-binding protein [Actinobacteria bacterium]|nr:extracellular solute-binding protein [Actinomycetota bacterium]